MPREEASLVTGGSGFLGRHLVRALVDAGHYVTVLTRTDDPAPDAATLVGDLAALDLGTFRGSTFHTVYHVGGLAHTVPRTPAERDRFRQVNAAGTEKLLAALEKAERLPESIVLASTVAVYGAESGTLLDEDTPRLASDPYGVSKREAEDIVAEWGSRRGVRVAMARLPLIAGAGAPGNLGAMVRGIRRGLYLGIGDGSARRSMVLARDLAAAFPTLAAAGGVYNLTDGHHPSFAELERALAAALGKRPPLHLPMSAAAFAARLGDAAQGVLKRDLPLNTRRLSKMVSTLTFSDARARREIGWAPSRVVDHAAELVG